jgi:hypothetical protein
MAEHAMLLDKNIYFDEMFNFVNRYHVVGYQLTKNPIKRFFYRYSKEWCNNLEKMNRDNYSLDEWMGFICYMEYFNMDKEIGYVPLFGRHSMRPDVFLFILMAKYKWLRPFLAWTQWIAMFLSCKKTHDKKPDGVHVATSGKLLSWVRLKAFRMTWTNKICMKLIKRGGIFDNWHDIFHYYHKNKWDTFGKDIPRVNFELI